MCDTWTPCSQPGEDDGSSGVTEAEPQRWQLYSTFFSENGFASLFVVQPFLKHFKFFQTCLECCFLTHCLQLRASPAFIVMIGRKRRWCGGRSLWRPNHQISLNLAQKHIHFEARWWIFDAVISEVLPQNHCTGRVADVSAAWCSIIIGC